MKKLFDEIPRLETERLVLRKMEDCDAAALGRMTSDPRVYRFLPTFLTERQSDDPHEAIRRFYGECFRKKTSLFLGIFRKDGSFCGMTELYGFREDIRKISLGCRLAHDAWGQRIGTEAVLRLIGYIYGETDTGIITASSMTVHPASGNSLRNAGFQMTVSGVPEEWGLPEPVLVDKWFR